MLQAAEAVDGVIVAEVAVRKAVLAADEASVVQIAGDQGGRVLLIAGC